ncbi:MAG TPA: hypothetical protein VGH85_06680 [Mycobacteriales bacterium]|jgi:hypothetical protein
MSIAVCSHRDTIEVPHPIIRSAEPGEDWSWCFIDDVAFVPNDRPRRQRDRR